MGEVFWILMVLVAWIVVPALVVAGMVLMVRRIRGHEERLRRRRSEVPGVATGHHRTTEAGGAP